MVDYIGDVTSPVKSKVSPSARRAYLLIHDMTPDELSSLRAKATALLAAPGGAPAREADAPPDAPRDPVDWLLAGMEAVLRSRGSLGRRCPLLALGVPDWPRLSAQERRRTRAEYAALSREAMRPLVRSLGAHPRPGDLAALGLLAAECAAERLQSRGIPVGPRTMLRSAGDVAAAVEASFPGYAARGMLGMCLTR